MRFTALHVVPCPCLVPGVLLAPGAEAPLEQPWEGPGLGFLSLFSGY